LLRLEANALDRFLRLAGEAIRAADRNVEDAGVGESDLANYNIAYQAIRKILERPQEHLPFAFLWTLGRPLEIAASVGRASPNDFTLFGYICDAVRQLPFVAAFDEEDAWVKALSIAELHRRANTTGLFALQPFSRGALVAAALSRLARRGFHHFVDARGGRLNEASFRHACTEIEGLVRRIGGVNVISSIFRILVETGKAYRGFFLYGRSTSQRPREQSPNVPWHFLYNLALKHLTETPASSNPQADWGELIEISRDLGATLDVEEYSTFESIGISPYLIDRALLDNVVYDELFSFQQWSAEISEQLFEWWMDALVSENCPIPIANAEHWQAMSKSLLVRAQSYEPTIAQVSDYISPNLPRIAARRLLNAIAAPASEINRNYRTPQDTKERNAPTYPTIRVGVNRYLVPPRGIAARALYERLFTLMRDHSDPSLDTKLGRALERLTVMILENSQHKPAVEHKKYFFPGTHDQYEVDLAVESERHIHLLECKRKALTSRARAGALGDVLIDLSKSFLEMLIQMSRHEIALRSAGAIRFRDGTTLGLGGRDIERIAVTMLDHGSLQNHVFIHNLVRAIIETTVSSDDPTMERLLRPVNDAVQQLRVNLQELAGLTGEEFGAFLQRYGFGTWWLSIDQLAALLRTGTTLWDTLRPVRHISFQTGDLMSEFAGAQRLAEESSSPPIGR
jgi:hypothetical protein